MSNHATHHTARKKKKSVLQRLRHQSYSTLMPNTYSRRMTRYSAYDFDNVTAVRGTDAENIQKAMIQRQEDKENLFLESLLTKIHDTTSKFLLVNTEHSDYPIVYVSDEFLNFWRYSRKQIFLKDGRLPMMVGESTDPDFVKDLGAVMSEVEGHHCKEYTLYKAGHQKTVASVVSVLTLPKHSKARYVLVATEEQSNSDTFGVDLVPKTAGCMEWMTRGTRPVDVNDDDYVPLVIQNRVQIRKDFEKENTSFFLMIHDNIPKIIWNWILLYSVLWNVFMIPLQMAFRMPCDYENSEWQITCTEGSTGTAKGKLFPGERILSIITDLLFILDVVMNCVTTYINTDGVVISDLRNIIKNYVKSWFFVDLIGAIPWEIIILAFGIKDDNLVHYIKAIALLRLLRILRNQGEYMSSGIPSFLFMMAVFVIFAHFFACAWFAIGAGYIHNKDGWLYKFVEQAQSPTGRKPPEDLVRGEPPYEQFNVDKTHYTGGLDPQQLYLTCLYFSFTSLSTVGFGNAAPQASQEKIFSVLIMVFGALLYASIFGNVASIIHRLNIETSELHRRQTELFDFISVHHFPESLSHRMEDYFYNYWFRTKGVDAHEIMGGWPKSLREDCYMYIHDLLLKRWPVLKDASVGCQRMLSEKLQRVIVCPGDTIYHTGDCVGEIYFIVRGHIKVIKSGRLIGVLTTGDIFGENFWPTRTARKSKANVQALTYCEFEVLTHESINEIMIEFPDYWDIWTNKLKISYELSAKGELFSQDTPGEFVRFVEDERTIATDDIIGKIREKCSVSDPKQYYFDLNVKRTQSAFKEDIDEAELGNTIRKSLKDADDMVDSLLLKMSSSS